MEQKIATSLLDIGAVSLRADPPFRWASGRMSPIYCDNRLLMAYPDRRKQIAAGFKALLAQLGWHPEVIAGTATAGIPHAAWLADLLDLPMVYVRGAAKDHGKENRIEGKMEKEQKVVLIEDLISTGRSSIEAALAVTAAGATLLGVAAIFTYGLDIAAQRFEEARIPLATLTTFDALLSQALSRGTLSAASKAILLDWQKDPAAWSVARGGAS